MSEFIKVRCPNSNDRIFKDECSFCFDTPEHSTGLYICMNTFFGLGKSFVPIYSNKTGNTVFLHWRRIKRELPPKQSTEENKPTKLAIGVEGGFSANESQFEFEDQYKVVLFPSWTEFELSNSQLPEQVKAAAAAIISADSAARAEELAALAGTWDGEKRAVSRHAASLKQLESSKRIPPSGWRCELCDKTDNLWLNLTDGSILCGRRFWDGTGGNNHALEHYTKYKYPLAVKLGTITPEGADVYSYEEDDMVEDPNLAVHLSHWGINITKMNKTERTMLEMEIDLNQRVGEWDLIQESGATLRPLYGAGYTGVHNLGNSCYMSSVIQTLAVVPDFISTYDESFENILQSSLNQSNDNFNLQMSKFIHGLKSGDYSHAPPVDPEVIKEPIVRLPNGVKPRMFKSLVGKGHAEFSTSRQQDAEEYLRHLFSLIEKNSRGRCNPTESFRFQLEEKIQCDSSGNVRYTSKDDYILSLPIPLNAISNKEAVEACELKKAELQKLKQVMKPEEVIRPRVSLDACLNSFIASTKVEDFYSSAIQAKTTAQRTTRLASFPDYLFIQMKKFTVGDDWVPKKLDVSLEMPDDLDITMLRAHGVQPGEVLLPDTPDTPTHQQTQVSIDDTTVEQLMGMGFGLDACRKAVFHSGNCGVEPATNWLMEHMTDPDFNDPFVVPGGGSGNVKVTADEEAIVSIMSMGFTRDQSIKALSSTDNNLERAVDWIFNHPDELNEPMEITESSNPSSDNQSHSSNCRDGSGKYKLVGFISHMGSSTSVGHYVCHLLKEGRWVIHNDEKVAVSENPPKDLGYLYLYKRV